MCGITGYVGSRQTDDVLIEGLCRLEYRGYDSCGIALAQKNGKLYLNRVSGRVQLLKNQVNERPPQHGMAGIGHTRWATHGAPSEENAHPHTDCTGELVVVHNGIIENYPGLKENLIDSGHSFKSETDTETIVHLIEAELKKICGGSFRKKAPAETLERNFFEAFRRAVSKLEGSFAVSAIWSRCPELIISARMHSPLVIGKGKDGNFSASDVSAFLKYTKQVYFAEDGDIAVIKKDSILFYDFKGNTLERKLTEIEWDAAMAEKGGYDHFMLKEIHEQPAAVENTLRGRTMPMDGYFVIRELGIPSYFIKSLEQIQFVACGTANHAALVGCRIFGSFGIPCFAEFASEFSDRAKMLNGKTLVIAISQSGETLDTIIAVREARAAGAKILAITNTVGSTLTRESDYTLYTRCGPEIGVASTKAFLGQLASLYILAGHFAVIRGTLDDSQAEEYAAELVKLPRHIEKILADEKNIRKTAETFSKSEHFLFISRRFNYPIALEGALKIKEISYVHAEGYAAGEMKHGPIAIIYPGMPVIAIAVSSENLELVNGNMAESKARGADVLAIVDEKSAAIAKAAHYIKIPFVPEIFSPMLTVIPLQMFAYYIALSKGCDIDKPRNLAKSVTVR